MQRGGALVLSFAAGLLPLARAHAEPAPQDASLLSGYLSLLEQKKLAAPEANSVDELTDLVQEAQRATLEGRGDEATSMLLEAVEGPRFRSFDGLEEFHTAELLLAQGLLEARALTSAQRVLDRMIARGPEQATFGPAYRKAVDVALLRGDLDASAEHLAKLAPGALPEDAQNELRYLRARAAYARADYGAAKRELDAITQRSRFYASAQYLLGAIAAKHKDYPEAEARFCRITTAGKDGAFSFYVDGRFFPVRDMAHLALGRVAHETARANDAFYYYFQVPQDSERLDEALFEAAWASYEGGDHDAALDSLDQLKARFPHSAYAAEAPVLRGYVHLSRCEFGAAESEFVRFEQEFGAVLREIDAIAQSPARRRNLYRDVMARARSIDRARAEGRDDAPDPDGVLLALMTGDPEFFRLHAQIRALSGELARGGNVPRELEALAQRVSNRDAPAQRLSDVPEDERAAALSARVAEAMDALSAFDRELSALKQARAPQADIDALRATRRKLEGRLAALETQRRKLVGSRDHARKAPAADDLAARFSEDRAYVERLRADALALRDQLEEAADRAGLRALEQARTRVAQELRRARIGRIDAVMGSKRQVELQVESLAAGRFPPELIDPLHMQSLLRDDEEYWPFEGENWPDEFVERYAKEAKR